MNRIRNAQIESVLSIVNSPSGSQTIVNQARNAEQINPPYFIMNNGSINLGIENISECVTYNKPINLTPNNISDQNVYFGTDTLEFAQQIVYLFKLSNELVGVTNIGQPIKFIAYLPGAPVNFNVRVTTLTGTSTYISFAGVNITKLFKSIITSGNVKPLSPVATFDVNGNVQHVNFI